MNNLMWMHPRSPLSPGELVAPGRPGSDAQTQSIRAETLWALRACSYTVYFYMIFDIRIFSLLFFCGTVPDIFVEWGYY